VSITALDFTTEWNWMTMTRGKSAETVITTPTSDFSAQRLVLAAKLEV